MNPTDEIRIRHRGAVRQSDWVDAVHTVSGGEVTRAFRKRPVPDGCRWYHPCEIERMPEPARSRAREIMAKHPRTRGIIAYIARP